MAKPAYKFNYQGLSAMNKNAANKANTNSKVSTGIGNQSTSTTKSTLGYSPAGAVSVSPMTPLPGRALPESPAGQERFNAPPLLPGESVSLQRQAFNRQQFDDTINTNFTELGVANGPDPASFDPSLATVGDFFTIYQSLFFQIPKDADINSHLFLVKESSEFLQYVAQQEEIDALREEILDLQQQNLDLATDIANVTNELTAALSDASNIG